MSTATKIEWTRSDDGTAGATWNPVTGCTKVSEGVTTVMRRRSPSGGGGSPGTRSSKASTWLWPDRLGLPLRRRKPTRYFVNSMSDL